MREHSIPIIELWGHLLVPLQGDIPDSQADDLQERLLQMIKDRSADGLVIDTSGVWMMDSHLCATIGKLARAARLMGARPVLCGLGPTMVLTLQMMGIDLDGVETALGLEGAMELLGVRVVRVHDDDEDSDQVDLDDQRADGEDDLEREDERGSAVKRRERAA
jgi:rsbT antagonist protein RsbS